MTFFKRIKFPEAVPEGEAHPPAGPRSAGHALRRRREELGLSLDEIGAALRIKPAYLAALEEGRPDRLPGSAYAVGFLKSYGEHLGLDGTEVVRRFKAESAGLDTKPDLSFPMPLGERSVPGGGTLLVALILVGCGYG
ncbi:MAG TPA: helix-turn-helix domain-containing protein, partial [Stellaceae bacterium]|nr:helix-turn-helix domain-containing protein [Stellaceae bacterium]